MVKVKIFSAVAPFDKAYIERPLRYAGLMGNQASEITNRIFTDLEKENGVPFEELIKYTATQVTDPRIKRNFSRINEFFLASYRKKLNKPFFILIGGSSGAGKDMLAGDISAHLGIDRSVPTDLFRDAVKEKTIKKYGNEEMVPPHLQPLLQASYKVDVKAFEFQVEHIERRIHKEFVVPAFKEYAQKTHPIYMLQGVHNLPGTNNYGESWQHHLVVPNPDKETFQQKTFMRQEKEQGPLTKENYAERMKDWENISTIQQYIVQKANEAGATILQGKSSEEQLHSFADSLTPKLEQLMYKAGIELHDL